MDRIDPMLDIAIPCDILDPKIAIFRFSIWLLLSSYFVSLDLGLIDSLYSDLYTSGKLYFTDHEAADSVDNFSTREWAEWAI